MELPKNGIPKALIQFLIVGVASGLIAWGASGVTLDSLKTTVADVEKWRKEHSIEQAGTTATVNEKLTNIEKILIQMEVDRKADMKEFRDELKKKKDRD